IGSSFIDHLERFGQDPDTRGVLIIGEIGGTAEEEAADYARARFRKPLIAFVAGLTAPPDKRMGHAGAIISGGKGKAEDKIRALESAGLTVVRNIARLGRTAKEVIGLT
ncbi:MAG: succinate--CoA ligase subunit alpha, partial [Deltaproteobacteria bacterium]|nr:succinate--CoA ligase subunit alpha [Deltaproteobacteria bacterium]